MSETATRLTAADVIAEAEFPDSPAGTPLLRSYLAQLRDDFVTAHDGQVVSLGATSLVTEEDLPTLEAAVAILARVCVACQIIGHSLSGLAGRAIEGGVAERLRLVQEVAHTDAVAQLSLEGVAAIAHTKRVELDRTADGTIRLTDLASAELAAGAATAQA